MTSLILPVAHSQLLKRALSPDNKINITIGTLSIVIGFLSVVLAWATWKLTRDRRRRLSHMGMYSYLFLSHILQRHCARKKLKVFVLGPPTDSNVFQTLATRRLPLGYELALRIGRSV